MATSRFAITEGSGKNIATHSIAEDAVTKEIQRVVLNNSSGADLSPGTLAEQQTQTTHLATIAGDTTAIQTAAEIMDDWDNAASDGASVSGDVAHDSADAGEPVKVGFKAYNQDGTAPGTAVTEGDRVNGIADLFGRQYVNTVHPYLFRGSENNATAQTNNELVAAPGAGLSLYITDIIFSNGATAGDIKLVEDTGGTPVDVLENTYLAVNGGMVAKLNTPIKLTANKNLGYTSTTVTTHSVTCLGYIAP